MVEFTPDYNVMYHGQFYDGGETFEIDEADVEEMKKHGYIEGYGNDEAAKSYDGVNPGNIEPINEAKPPAKRGRPRKTE